MKKLITTFALAIAIPAMVSAQGTVNFASTSAQHVIQQGGVSVASGFATVGLYGGALGASDAQLVLLGATVLNGAGGGINAGSRTATVAGGAMGQFQVRAWTGGFATYEAAIASGNASFLAGKSASFANATGDPAGTPPTPPANLTGWTSPVQLTAVPEPSTIALGLLGAGSLLFLRRKK